MGKLAKVKTTENSESVEDFLNGIQDERKRADSFLLLKMMQTVSKQEPKMWGGSIVGFGKMIYKSPTSGREVEWFIIGFSPRKAALTIYVMNVDVHADALKSLGKHKTGGGCLYINKLEDIDIKVLKKILVATVKSAKG
ncbi:MAG: DUF1801 domain-containing protein [Bacteroidetes bacterium]|nr:DUF1801 domain-containing protein [Bacteroidota bacterium]